MKTKILTLTNTVTPDDSKTNMFHSFELDKDFNELEIRFSYFPKTHESREKSLNLIEKAMAIYAPVPYQNAYGRADDYLPIVNLLTVSIEDPLGYRGCAHRHDDQQTHFISEASASPGFYKGKIVSGIWRIGINLHCVITDSCIYSLEVLAGGETAI